MATQWLRGMAAIALAVMMGFTAYAQDDEMGGGGDDGGAVKKEKKAKGEKGDKAEKPKPQLEDLTIEGTVTKKESKKTDKKTNQEVTITDYILTDAEGNEIKLPKPMPPKAKKGGEAADAPAAINLDDYVDKAVTVTGKGVTAQKGDKKVVQLKSITSIQVKAADANKEEGAGGAE